jgi:hypothetical protein
MYNQNPWGIIYNTDTFENKLDIFNKEMAK